MGVTASLQFTQAAGSGSAGAVPAGQAALGATGLLVTARNFVDSNVNEWFWEFLSVPPGSAIPIRTPQDGSLNSYQFTPDVRGGYLMHLLVKNTIDGSQAEDWRVFEVAQLSGRRIPPFLATDFSYNIGGQARGWAQDMETWLQYVDTLHFQVPGVRSTAVSTPLVAFVDYWLICTGRAAAITITLPTMGVGTQKGVQFEVTDADGTAATKNIIVSGSGGQNILGAGTYTISTNWQSNIFRWNGTLWNIV